MNIKERGKLFNRFTLLTVASFLTVTLAGIGVLVISNILGRLLLLSVVTIGWLIPVMLASHYRAVANSRMDQLRKSDLQGSQDSVVRVITKSRKDASRHEYHQEQSLRRIENNLRSLRFREPLKRGSESSNDWPDIFFITSNGAGLGHITRLLAIADELPPEIEYEMLTLSRAYKQVAERGVPIHYFPSSEAAGVPPGKWNRVFGDYLTRLFKEKRPRLIVFDGTWIYSALNDVCSALNIPIVWVQRGLWKPEVDRESPQRHSAVEFADYLIIPGDYAETEFVDAGPGIQPIYVDPIVRSSRFDRMPRDAACTELGLDPNKRYVMINLGGGTIGMPESFIQNIANILADLGDEIIPVRIVSPLAAANDTDDESIAVSAYPVMKYASAFEFVIAAGGYNSVQEIACLHVPSILIPNEATKTDDQVRRVNGMAKQNYCLTASDIDSMRSAIQRIQVNHERQQIVSRLANLRPPRGAEQAASAIMDALEKESWMDYADSFMIPGEPDAD